MNQLRRIFRWLLGGIATILVVVVVALLLTSLSPIYSFAEPQPFEGNDIYNPYKNWDTTQVWRRANFHTHTKVEGILNECDYSPNEVLDEFGKYNYDIITLSNHNEITTTGSAMECGTQAYEHGYNLLKSHTLVYGAEDVCRYDMLLPILVSQRQFMLDMLSRDGDMLQINHPLRTHATSDEHMRLLSGYQLMELDSGRSTENEYWDEALSAGHYVLGVANDDMHYPDRSRCIAVRCNFVALDAMDYPSLREALCEGCFYAMRVPDYGDGDWQQKIERNAHLPSIEDIGLRGDEIYISLSECADSIKFTGAHHRTLHSVSNASYAAMTLQHDEPYARITAYIPSGEVIYSQPFARYNSATMAMPRNVCEHSINIPLTLIFNIAIVALVVAIVVAYVKFLRR